MSCYISIEHSFSPSILLTHIFTFSKRSFHINSLTKFYLFLFLASSPFLLILPLKSTVHSPSSGLKKPASAASNSLSEGQTQPLSQQLLQAQQSHEKQQRRQPRMSVTSHDTTSLSSLSRAGSNHSQKSIVSSRNYNSGPQVMNYHYE